MDEIPTFAPSLTVPNVQEMVIKNPLEVPERYKRNEIGIQADMSHHVSPEIPIIDLSLLSMENKDELTKLEMACKEWGFFQVINHGMSSLVIKNMKDSSAEFFDLPLEEKTKVVMPHDDIQGYGHAYVVEEDQVLDWSDALIMLVYPSKLRKLSIWPDNPKQFKEAIENYSTELNKVAKELFGSLSLVMGMNKSSLLELHNEIWQALRVNYYPPCSLPGNVLGVSPHSDPSTITILIQHDDVSGLHIRRQGRWVPIKPLQNALVVNVGDVFEILSNGKYKSVEHRAVTNASEARISYVTFFYPSDDTEIEPLSHMIGGSEGSIAMYKRVKYGEYLRQSMKMRHDGKAHTQLAKAES